MRSVTVRLDDLRTTILCLGYVGENEHTRINIDAKKMYDQYPSASASLTVCPPEGESYPAVITRDGDMVIWDITDSDLVAEGSGEIQLSFTQGETVAKTFIGRFKVSRSLVPTGDIPSGLDDFLTRAGAALTAIPETIDEALAEAKASGEFDGADGQDGQDGADGFSPIATVTKSGNKATISITDANGTTTAEVTDGADGAPGQDGAPGIDGFSPRATVSKSGSTATITITDAAGTTTAQISDGESADIIDDTAGAGDTDKVWSADKSAAENSSLLTEITKAQDDVQEVKDSAFTTESESESVTTETEIQSTLTWEDGYVSNGTFHSSTTYTHTQIQVLPGDVITIKDGGDNINGRFVDQMSGASVVEAQQNQSPITVLNNADSIVVSFNKVYISKPAFKVILKRTTTVVIEKLVLDTDKTPTKDSEKPITSGGVYSVLKNTEKNAITLSFDLSAGATYEDPQERSLGDACGYSLSFFAKISGNLTGQIIIGKGFGNNDGGAIGIDATNVYIYLNGATETPTATKPHNISAFADYISVVLDVGYVNDACKIRIKTNGAESTVTPSSWRSQQGDLSVSSSLDALTDCVLSYAVPALDNEIWMYGDSYFSISNNARWTYWLISEGHTKFLLNSDPGRKSPAALAALHLDLDMSKKPKKIVWCMGMNDKDGDSAPNEDWQDAIEEVEEICESIGAELILATIPNVPASSTKNTLKNAYVVASGRRYIDFANAVSADGSSTWYANMLNQDNVHPDKEGAKALYGAAVTAVPELLK